MRRLPLLIGPALYLAAELVLPGGSADPGARLTIITGHHAAWELGHQLILVAFAFLLTWLLSITMLARQKAPLLADLGAWFVGFALLANFGIGVLQLVALELARGAPAQALAVLEMLAGSSSLLLFLFLPYLGFVPGCLLLAVALARGRRAPWAPALLGVAGILIGLGGVTQVKGLLIAGSALLLLSSVGILPLFPPGLTAPLQAAPLRD